MYFLTSMEAVSTEETHEKSYASSLLGTRKFFIQSDTKAYEWNCFPSTGKLHKRHLSTELVLWRERVVGKEGLVSS